VEEGLRVKIALIEDEQSIWPTLRRRLKDRGNVIVPGPDAVDLVIVGLVSREDGWIRKAADSARHRGAQFVFFATGFSFVQLALANDELSKPISFGQLIARLDQRGPFP